MSLRLEMGREAPLSADEWVKENLEFIARKLEERRQSLVGTVEPSSILDLNERWLSEMPICEAWREIKNGAGLPSGFKLIWTEVFVSGGDPFGPQIGHFVAVDRQNYYLCITPGQFVHTDGRLVKPGERIMVLQQKAPEFITLYSGGIAVLYGQKEAVGKRLGIWY